MQVKNPLLSSFARLCSNPSKEDKTWSFNIPLTGGVELSKGTSL